MVVVIIAAIVTISFIMFTFLQAIKWMEQRLTASNTTLILVTHDRMFMEAVCTGILELDQGTAHLHSFGGEGSYDRFRQVYYHVLCFVHFVWS